MNTFKRTLALLALPAALMIAGCSGGEGDNVCEPGCDANACMTCDDGTCVSTCGAGQVCDGAGQCIAEQATCEPACDADACMTCDTTGDAPACVSACAEGETCDGAGQCVAEVACDPACEDNYTCQEGACVFVGHAELTQLAGPFADGPAVTDACLGCHTEASTQVMASAHFQWAGPTPNLVGHETDDTVGKKNLINNYCVAIEANEARCTQCHAGYGWTGPDYLANATANQVDCLVCHADMAWNGAIVDGALNAGTYTKDPKTAGAAPAEVDLAVAAQSVGTPSVDNCGWCHFKAGGGNNVKKGDMGSGLAVAANTSDPSIDRHLGSTHPMFEENGCAACHKAEAHLIPGQGIHIPVAEGRVACTDCHTGDHAPDHSGVGVAAVHFDRVACQTCHIPAFSRQMPTKMSWDWSTAGNKNRGVEHVDGDPAKPESYNWMKGDFTWGQSVTPRYAYYSGKVTHLTTTESFSEAGTAEDRVVIAAPVSNCADPGRKLMPFKVFEGRQAADAQSNLLLVPDLFGPGAFWKVIGDCDPAATDCDYSVNTAQGVALWNTVLTEGALAAGQIPAGESYVGLEGQVTPGAGERTWKFVDTEMWQGINHEVAPKEQALRSCGDCHFGVVDFVAMGWSADPASDSSATCTQ